MALRPAALVLLLHTLAWSGVCATPGAKGDRTPEGYLGYLDHQDSRREVDEDDHGHDHEGEESVQCVIDTAEFIEAFNEVAKELNVTGESGQICKLPQLECHDHDEEEDDDDHHHDEEGEEGEDDHHDEEGSGAVNDTECQHVYEVCKEIIIHTVLLPPSCLSGECGDEHDDEHDESSDRPTAAQAYGYGFLMVILVCLFSLLGVLVIPLLKNGHDKKKGEKSWRVLVYKYLYFFMIALGTSALLSDAVLHLLPHAWELHAHDEEEEGGHAHDHASDGGGPVVEEFIWKGTVALIAIYIFFLLEFILHGFSSHTHSHGVPTDTEECVNKDEECIQLDTSVPHGECAGGTGSNILHPPSGSKGEMDGEILAKDEVKGMNGTYVPKKAGIERKGLLGRLRKIKPLAWLIIVGDGLHNFADGLALGAAISQSLTLGVSTMIALILHELPHEFGDYVILLSTGLSWYSALLLNFASSLTAILGFFVGVAVGTESEEVNSWILAFAAGLFIYIALVDLLPELIHSKERGPHRSGLFFSANLGFWVSFLILFLLAVYEEDINSAF